MAMTELRGSALVTRALAPDNLFSAYQRIVDLQDGTVLAYEALLHQILAREKTSDRSRGEV